MIRRSTLFILGSGASRDFGYPTGVELASWLTGKSYGAGPKQDQTPEFQVRYNFFEKITSQSWRDSFSSFSTSFLDSGSDSIDSYLSSRAPYQRIGKVAIAGLIVSAERLAIGALFNYGTWYRYLFNLMKDECKNFDQFKNENKIKIVTFNYDVSLELFLTKACSEFWEIPLEEAETLFETIHITHVHGKVAGFSWEPEFKRKIISIHRNQDMATFDEIADGIRIYSETDQSGGKLALPTAEFQNIFSLGFGFLRENLDKLFPKSGHQYQLGIKKIRSNAYDLRLGERSWIGSLFTTMEREASPRGMAGAMIRSENPVIFTNGGSLDLLREYRDLLS